jgi:hypothetical protein
MLFPAFILGLALTVTLKVSYAGQFAPPPFLSTLTTMINVPEVVVFTFILEFVDRELPGLPERYH